MRSSFRPHLVLVLLLALLFVLVPTTAAFAGGYWNVTGRVLDADTGLPATGVTFAVYAWDPELNMLTEAHAGLVSSTGRFSAEIAPYKPWAIVCFGGRGVYCDQFWGGLRTNFMAEHFHTGADPVVALSGDQAVAKRLSRPSGASASFGDTWLEVVPRPYGLITGRVTDRLSGAGFYAFQLSIYKYDETKGRWVVSGWSEGATGDGSYNYGGYSGSDLLSGIRLGFAMSTHQGWVTRFYPDAASVEDAVTLDLKAGDIVRGLDMQVDFPNRLKGTVMQTESKTPLEDARVSKCTTDALGAWDECGGPDTSSSGAYCLPEIWGLEPGDYRLAVFDRSHEYDQTYYGQTKSLATATTIHLEQGQIVGGLDVWMSNHAAVAGTVLDPGGARRPDVRVTAYRRTSGGTWEDAGTDYSDSSGRYRVLVGSAGTYTLRFTDRAGSYESADDTTFYLGGATSLASATTIAVSRHAATVPAPFRLSMAPDPDADRVWASSDVASAIAVSKSAFPSDVSPAEPLAVGRISAARLFRAADDSSTGTLTVVLTATGHYDEAICAAGLAGAAQAPLLMTKSTEFYTGLIGELKRLGTKQIYVVGGKSTVPERQLALLRSLGYSVERLAGVDRYETSAIVARKIASISRVTSTTPVFIVRGDDTADGYIAAPAAYAARGIVLLVGRTATPKAVASVVRELGLRKGYALGDKTHLPTSALSGLSKAGMVVTRGSTSTSAYTRAASFATVAAQRGWLGSDGVGLVCLSSLGQSIASPVALGQARAPLLFVTKTSLPTQTADLLKRRSKTVDIVRIYSRASTVGTKVLLRAGSY